MVLQGGGHLPKLILTIFMLGSKTKVKQLLKLWAEEGGWNALKKSCFFLGDLPYCSI